MADELIDIFDDNQNPCGTAWKSESHRRGLWHKTFHCWIVQKQPDETYQVWLQLRSHLKSLSPNLFDISSSGHLQAGESYQDGIREVKEELGLDAEIENLVKLFSVTEEFQCGDIYNREYNDIFALETSTPLHQLILQPDEVDGVFTADIRKLLALVNKEISEIVVKGIYLGEHGNQPQQRTITYQDMVSHTDEYYRQVFSALADLYCH